MSINFMLYFVYLLDGQTSPKDGSNGSAPESDMTSAAASAAACAAASTELNVYKQRIHKVGQWVIKHAKS